MTRRNRKMRLIIGSVAAIIAAAALGFGWIGWKFFFSPLWDSRDNGGSEQTSAETGAETEVSSGMEDALQKAQKWTDKKIAMKDAVEFASILLKSKLSAQEIADLLEASESRLSQDELRRVRETLLKKLTQEEIDALRQIARQYGRNLDILDPNVPIGKSRSQKRDEEQSVQKGDETKTNGADAAQANNGASPAGGGKPGSGTAAGKANISEPAPLPEADASRNRDVGTEPDGSMPAPGPERREETRQKYEERLHLLQAQCERDVKRLEEQLSRLMRQVEDGKTPDMTPAEFARQLKEAESRCDRSFRYIIQSAEQEYARYGWDMSDIGVAETIRRSETPIL